MNNLYNIDYLTDSETFEIYKTAYFIYLDKHTDFTPSFDLYVTNFMSQDEIHKATVKLRKLKLKEIFNGEL